MPQWQNLFTVLRDHDINVSDHDMPRPVGGGDISSAWRVRADNDNVFLKTGAAGAYDMFLAEAEGLRPLKALSNHPGITSEKKCGKSTMPSPR